MAPDFKLRHHSTTVIPEALTIYTLSPMAIDLPGLTHFAASPTVCSPFSFKVHVYLYNLYLT